jgi:Flp pilus assembly protein TadD
MVSAERSATGRMTGPELWQVSQAHVLEGRIDQAIRTLQSLLTMHPGQIGARMLLAAVLLSTGNCAPRSSK